MNSGVQCDLKRGDDVHLIPVYTHGYTYNLLSPSMARQPRDTDADFNWYYINQYIFLCQFTFANHIIDLLIADMRLRDVGVSHKSTRETTQTSPRTETHSIRYHSRRKVNLLACSACQVHPWMRMSSMAVLTTMLMRI